MITQYVSSTPSADVQAIVANRVGLLDSYILMQTAQNEYTALIRDNVTQKVRSIRVWRQNTTGGQPWQVSESETTWNYSLTNEYYTFSNVGAGRALSLPVYDAIQAWAVVIVACFAMLAVVFKGVLFRCVKRRR